MLAHFRDKIRKSLSDVIVEMMKNDSFHDGFLKLVKETELEDTFLCFLSGHYGRGAPLADSPRLKCSMEKRQEIFQNFLNKKLLITDNDMLSMQENEDESEDAESNFGESQPLHKDNEHLNDALHALDASDALDAKWMDKIGYLPDQ